MYPFLRLAVDRLRFRNAPALGRFDTHVGPALCWPWDLDMFGEMNNGRILTLYDLGRFGLGRRTGLFDMLRREGWGLTVAGSSIRYRRRVRVFDRLEMRTRLAGWDARFIYMEQSLWHRSVCTSHLLIRSAITDSGGLVSAGRFGPAMGLPPQPPSLPDWVAAWVAAEAERPWPPMHEPAHAAGLGKAA